MQKFMFDKNGTYESKFESPQCFVGFFCITGTTVMLFLIEVKKQYSRTTQIYIYSIAKDVILCFKRGFQSNWKMM